MAWRYKIVSVQSLVDEKFIEFNVEFSNTTPGDTRIINKNYRVWVDELPDTTIQTLKAIVDLDKAKLVKFDQLSASLTQYIGQYF